LPSAYFNNVLSRGRIPWPVAFPPSAAGTLLRNADAATKQFLDRARSRASEGASSRWRKCAPRCGNPEAVEDLRSGESPLTRNAISVYDRAENEAPGVDGSSLVSISGHAHTSRPEMPGFIKPQLATLKSKAPVGNQWLHEIKFDGYRVQVHIKNGNKKVYTRNGLDWTKRFL
jgi:hypothetical protein